MSLHQHQWHQSYSRNGSLLGLFFFVSFLFFSFISTNRQEGHYVTNGRSPHLFMYFTLSAVEHQGRKEGSQLHKATNSRGWINQSSAGPKFGSLFLLSCFFFGILLWPLPLSSLNYCFVSTMY